jgi:hypothetical protein
MKDVKEWLGENNTIGIDIWNKKYRHKNETFDEWLNRVSGRDDKLKKLIEEKKFLEKKFPTYFSLNQLRKEFLLVVANENNILYV